jgi:acetyl-CoA acetyltransferase
VQAVAENGIPTSNVGGGCAAGGIAVHAAYSMIASGQCDLVAAVGAERMPKGFIPRPPGIANDITDTDYLRWVAMGATNPAYWALEMRRRMHEHGTSERTLALASVLMHANAAGNPLARYRSPCSVDEVLASPMVSDPLRLLEICAVSDGAAAIILGSEDQARRRGGPLVQVAGCATATGQFGDPSVRVPGIAMPGGRGAPHTSEVVLAVQRSMQMAGAEHKDIDLLEMADNTAWLFRARAKRLDAWQGEAGHRQPIADQPQRGLFVVRRGDDGSGGVASVRVGLATAWTGARPSGAGRARGFERRARLGSQRGVGGPQNLNPTLYVRLGQPQPFFNPRPHTAGVSGYHWYRHSRLGPKSPSNHDRPSQD